MLASARLKFQGLQTFLKLAAYAIAAGVFDQFQHSYGAQKVVG